MSENSNIGDNKRIAKNTIVLYARMVVMTILIFLMQRYLLKSLGASDMGLYSAVGGVVMIFSFIKTSMEHSTFRFVMVALGKNDKNEMLTTFFTSFMLHLAIGILMVLLIEGIAYFWLLPKLSIPAGRETAAVYVFHLSAIGVLFEVMRVPYSAEINAHERMDAYAILTLIDAAVKLGFIIALMFYDGDRLILFAAMILLWSIIMTFIYHLYCKRNFSEVRYKPMLNRKLAKSIVTFSGWELFNSISWSFATQGITIMLNIFYGTIINAARSISLQVGYSLQTFSLSIFSPVKPQVVKNYAIENYSRSFNLVCVSSRYCMCLLLMACIPLTLEIEYILRIWLGDYPQHTDFFIIVMILQAMNFTGTKPLLSLIHAEGDVKWVNIASSINNLLLLPESYLLMHYGVDVRIVYLLIPVTFMIEQFINLYFAHRKAKLPTMMFIRSFYFIGGTILITSAIIPTILHFVMPMGWLRLSLVIITSIICVAVFTFTLGMDKDTRQKLITFARGKLHLAKH